MMAARTRSVDPCSQLVEVKTADGVLIASSKRTVRIKETGCAPVYYVPPADVNMEFIVPEAGSSFCPWKGTASYWSVKTKTAVINKACWSYHEPLKDAEAIKDYLAFYTNKLECFVDGERV